jgi:tetratricopeptide (TPR) repeat protein
MSNDPNNAILGQAWELHRNAQSEEAVATFKTLLAQDANDIEANYGISLALKASGNKEGAIEHMKVARESAIKALRDLRKQAEIDGQHIANNLNTTLDDRYMMLVRMTLQRLRELGVDVKATEEETF